MKNSMRNRITALINRYLRAYEIPFESDFLMEINDQGLMTVSGCTDITLYEPTCIILCCSAKRIIVNGKELMIKNLNRDITAITGIISAIELSGFLEV